MKSDEITEEKKGTTEGRPEGRMQGGGKGGEPKENTAGGHGP